ncbi:unnamed protein product [Pleuronectes platessa]|uniref:Uncharacterized protein n=1 Tax=Pleuronectes platessa TaxID=8262 RepID=A0A9N7UYI8_PLEPL|nr:unnamed protein product [Pleuronectes platessa]
MPFGARVLAVAMWGWSRNVGVPPLHMTAEAFTVPPQAVSTGFLNHLRLAPNHWKAEVVLKLWARRQSSSQLNTTHLLSQT